MKVICFKHPEYLGTSSPVLSCKTCCGIFVTEIKARNASGQTQDTYRWIAEKKREAEDAIRAKAGGINPKA